MTVEQIKETDTLNQGRIKINAVLDQSNASSQKVDDYQVQLTSGIDDAKKIAADAGQDAVNIATVAGEQANVTANQALANSVTAVNTSNQAVSTANNNKQEFDALRNDFDQLVAESGDSNPEIVQARTDTQGVKRPTLATRLQVDFYDRMTKADGVALFSGTTNVKVMMDFNGKTAGNTATNPHKYFADFTAKVLKKPADTWNEVSQADYNKLASRDDSGVITGSTQSGVIPQQMTSFDVVETAKKLTPQLYVGLTRQQVATQIKDTFVSFTISMRVKATSPNNKNVKVATYVKSTDSWTTQIQESATALTDYTVQINDKNFITDDGYIHVISYTDPSNGVSPSSLEMDYVGTQLEITVNPQDILDKTFATETQLKAHIDNVTNPHKVTATQVGLGNVGNYTFANDGEAVAGTSTVKYMHPKNVSDAIKGQAVTQTGDQEVSGIKNFKDGLQIKGVDVAKVSRPAQLKIADVANSAVYKGGNLTAIRVGNVVELVGFVNLVGVGNWSANLIATLPQQFRPVDIPSVTDGHTFNINYFNDNGTAGGLVLRVTSNGSFYVMRNQMAPTVNIFINLSWLAEPM